MIILISFVNMQLSYATVKGLNLFSFQLPILISAAVIIAAGLGCRLPLHPSKGGQ